jgi:hypothetical protein
LATAFGDSDDEGNDLDGDVLDKRDEDHEVQGPDSMDEPSPPARVAHPQPQPPFDMVDFMHTSKSSSYDMQKVFAEDDHFLPRHVPSERPGGEAHRQADGEAHSPGKQCILLQVCLMINRYTYYT